MIDKNPTRLVRLVYKLNQLVIKTSSKMRELQTYNETVNDLINKNSWKKAIDKEF